MPGGHSLKAAPRGDVQATCLPEALGKGPPSSSLVASGGSRHALACGGGLCLRMDFSSVCVRSPSDCTSGPASSPHSRSKLNHTREVRSAARGHTHRFQRRGRGLPGGPLPSLPRHQKKGCRVTRQGKRDSRPHEERMCQDVSLQPRSFEYFKTDPLVPLAERLSRARPVPCLAPGVQCCPHSVGEDAGLGRSCDLPCDLRRSIL